MTLHNLFVVQRNDNKLKSLYMELADHEDFNPYKGNVVTDMPKGGIGLNFSEWYTEEKERIEREIEIYKVKMQQDRKNLDKIIEEAPYPESEIIQYRIVNNMGWSEIGEVLSMDRTGVSKRFRNYINKIPTFPV